MRVQAVLIAICYISLQTVSGADRKEGLLIPTNDSNTLARELLDLNNDTTYKAQFDPLKDANALHKNINGLVINEMDIIDILARRTRAERLEIADEYQRRFNKPLTEVLDSKLFGDFKDLILALLTPLPLLYAKELYRAMHGIGTDEDALIDILCTLRNQQINEVCAIYEKTFERSLESSLNKDTSGHFRDLMLTLSSASRDETEAINKSLAVIDAQQLLHAGKLKWGTDESKFIQMLAQRNYNQLRLTFSEYQNISSYDVEETIKKEFFGDIKGGLLAIIAVIRNTPGFFAERLHATVAGLNVNKKQLIRIMVTRNEIDMSDIVLQYKSKYGNALAEDIAAHTSEYFRKCLLALIGEF